MKKLLTVIGTVLPTLVLSACATRPQPLPAPQPATTPRPAPSVPPPGPTPTPAAKPTPSPTPSDEVLVMASINSPSGVAWGRAGTIVVQGNANRVWRIDPEGVLEPLAGTGAAGYDGDGPQATALRLDAPTRAAVDAYGNVFFSDTGNHLVRCIDPTGRLITVVGGGSATPSADPEQGTDAALGRPMGLTFGDDGTLYIADAGLRKVLAFGGDGRVQALQADYLEPVDVAVTGAGRVYVADRRAGQEGVVVLPGTRPFWSENPIALGPNGRLLVADTQGGRILSILP